MAGHDRPVMDRDELHRVVSEAARNGSIPAMKLLWEMLRSETEGEPEPDSFSVFDGIIPRLGELSPYRRGD